MFFNEKNNNQSDKVRNSAIVKQALQIGADLIQIDSHNTTCKICMQYEGKIFSITGKEFPLLIDVPPFCDDCKHVASIIFREILVTRKILDKFIAFSHGKTEEHPFNKSFIPISIRPKIDLGDELKIRKQILSLNKKIKLRESKLTNLKQDSKGYSRLKSEINTFLNDKCKLTQKLKLAGSWFKVWPDIKDHHIDLSDEKLGI